MGFLPRVLWRPMAGPLAAVFCGWLAVVSSVATAAETAPARPGVGATFDVLQVGPTSYQHVQVRSVTARTLMISHSGGLASIRLRDLSPDLQAVFGYDAAAEAAADAALKSAPPPTASKSPNEGAEKSARKSLAAGSPSFDALLQRFGQPPEIRPSVDLRPKFFELALNVKNQGPRPSCAVFAIVSALEFQNAQLSGQAERFSEEYLVWATFKTLHRAPRARAANDVAGAADTENPESLDSVDEGFALSEVVTALRTYGIPLQSSLPYSFAKSTATEMPPAVVEEARSHRRVSVFALPGHDQPTRIANLIHALDAGVPVAVGARWPASRSIRTGYLNAQKPLEGAGHAVTVVGYENKTGNIADTVFTFKNSWGVKWGAGGYGYATYAYLLNNLTDTALLEIGPATPAKPSRD